MSWLTQQDVNGNVHNTPIDDVIEHEESHKCPCGPMWELGRIMSPCPHIHTAWMFTHHSADGREAHEHG